MMFTVLEEAPLREVRKWLLESIPDLTDYQKEEINEEGFDMFSGSDLYFYRKTEPQKVTFWWRLTILIFPFVWLLLFAGLPFNMLFTGQWGYGRKFNDKFLKQFLVFPHLILVSVVVYYQSYQLTHFH